MDKTQTNGGYPEMRIPKMDGLGIQNSNEIGCLLPNLHFPLFRNQQGPSFYQIHRIGLWENLQESPIFDGKNHGFL